MMVPSFLEEIGVVYQVAGTSGVLVSVDDPINFGLGVQSFQGSILLMAQADSDDALHVHSLGVLNVFAIYPDNNTQWKHGVEWLIGKAHSL